MEFILIHIRLICTFPHTFPECECFGWEQWQVAWWIGEPLWREKTSIFLHHHFEMKLSQGWQTQNTKQSPSDLPGRFVFLAGSAEFLCNWEASSPIYHQIGNLSEIISSSNGLILWARSGTYPKLLAMCRSGKQVYRWGLLLWCECYWANHAQFD